MQNEGSARKNRAPRDADILHKNLKIVLEYEEAKKRVGDLYEKLQEAKKRFNAFDEGYRSLNQNRVYRVIQ